MGKKFENGPPIKALKGAGWDGVKFEKKQKMGASHMLATKPPSGVPTFTVKLDDFSWSGPKFHGFGWGMLMPPSLNTPDFQLKLYPSEPHPSPSYSDKAIRFKIDFDEKVLAFLDRWSLSDAEWQGVYLYFAPDQWTYELAQKKIYWSVVYGVVGQSHYDPNGGVIMGCYVIPDTEGSVFNTLFKQELLGKATGHHSDTLWWVRLRRNDDQTFNVTLQGRADMILAAATSVVDSAV